MPLAPADRKSLRSSAAPARTLPLPPRTRCPRPSRRVSSRPKQVTRTQAGAVVAEVGAVQTAREGCSPGGSCRAPARPATLAELSPTAVCRHAAHVRRRSARSRTGTFVTSCRARAQVVHTWVLYMSTCTCKHGTVNLACAVLHSSDIMCNWLHSTHIAHSCECCCRLVHHSHMPLFVSFGNVHQMHAGCRKRWGAVNWHNCNWTQNGRAMCCCRSSS